MGQSHRDQAEVWLMDVAALADLLEDASTAARRYMAEVKHVFN